MPPRLTLRGIAALVAVDLAIGPASAFGIGIPLYFLNEVARYALAGGGHGSPHVTLVEVLTSVPESFAAVVLGLPFYGPWAEVNLWPVAAWVAAGTVLVATTRRGLRIADAALLAGAAVLALPALVDRDGPNPTWGYPDAWYMAVAAAGAASLCAALVRGFGAVGVRRRVAWGWLA